ncbi:MAG: multicopper oxidase domain-containing protein [Mojavia pulchra JT2-VF2]|jgi:FtsP/CotA-like multicopper oxidase with cupredoxin domain|uniref:Multicopper oxidase domain-containing protein n=1 Tax=Mojavia pulchra JT2-VF2 TaxID=287848 RepID=A0A951PYJ8_9NOST|nr:multicopper oxidase domain-containing protein [Mojavia pulchra JT2-VF2]
MANPTLQNAYVIGKSNFDSWSQGFDAAGYLKVLPHPDQKVVFKDPFIDWQKDHQNYKNGQFNEQGATGSYYSSWGPDKELNVTLKMSDLLQTQIDGFGIVKSGDGIIPWLNNEKTPYEILRGYNGLIPGPMLITEPGDTLKIKLENDLTQTSNLHTHGLHVSPLGDGDNVLVGVKPGETRDISVEIPDNHFIGLDWYHPHLHGRTNEQVNSGLGGLLAVNPPYNLPDLDKYNPTTRPYFNMAINSFGIQQVLRSPSPNDPLNTSPDPNLKVPAGTPVQVLAEENGQKVYELSDAPFAGFNAKPGLYKSDKPTGDPATFSPEYGSGGLITPVENVIHTVNGQYNPTIDLKTGEWDLFSFANMSTNTFHVIQLLYDDGTKLVPQTVSLVAIDGDAAGVVTNVRRQVTELPVLNPGSRLAVQHWFDKPGKYYFLSNGTEELLGENAPTLTKDRGFQDGHLIWGSQVLATVEVAGDPIPQGAFPEPYNTLVEQSQKINDLVNKAQAGEFDRERTYIWDANIGGALLEGNFPRDTEVESFEGTYTINGRYFSTEPGGGMTPLAMPMLGTTEIWNIVNRSGLPNPNLPPDANIPLSEWHPFHIHQNDFTVLSINGISVDDIDGTYLARVLSDTIALPPAYIDGTATPENPYGTPFNIQTDDPAKGKASEVKILMKFEDFPGSYVNHCHILFHEDAGMMMVVRPILNTKNIWLGLGSNDGGQIDLFRANNLFAANNQSINLTPYGKSFKKGIDVAIADVGYKGRKDEENKNVTDNVTDVITIQSSLEKSTDKFTIKVFDGKRLIEAQEGKLHINAEYELGNGGAELKPDLARADVFGKDTQASYQLTDLEGSTYLKRNPSTGEFTANSDPKVLGETDPTLQTKTFEFKGNNGGKLFGTESAQGKINPDFTVDNKGSIKITGGDGKFQDATGELSFIEKGRFTNPQTEPNLAPYVGTLSLNGTLQTKPQTNLNGNDKDLLIKEFNPFQDIAATTDQVASVASGDIDGDGFADIVAGLGGGVAPIIEIYSGKDYQLKVRINPFHHEVFKGKINLALGDVNGDNYDDIIVAQGIGGRGLVELYDGKLINEKGTLVGKDTAHDTALLSKEFQPYGTSYTGEVDVTSGYILQRPDEPNGFTTQTNNANITTIAKGSVPAGKEQIQVFTYLGGGHSHDEGTHESGTDTAEEVRLEVSLTPTGNTQEIVGSFADLLDLPKGEPVLFTRKQNGEYGIIHLGDENKPESFALATGSAMPKLKKNADNDVFTISSNSIKAKLKITLNGRSSNLVNELGVFVVDDAQGTINGIAPGTSGYTQAALARSKEILSAIANSPNGFSSENLTRLLEFNSGDYLRFYLVRNSSSAAVISGVTSTTEVLFADVSTVKIADLGDDSFSLAWKDGSNNSTEFKDLVVKIQSTNDSLTLGTSLQGKPHGEQLDFRGVTQLVKAEFVVNREAVFNNFVGFYQTVDEDGGIDTNNDGQADILPGQAGYTQAAVRGRVAGIDLAVNNQGTATYNGSFTPGGIFVPFLIVDGRPDAILDSNSNNDPSVYFPFLGANSDKVDHIRMLGNNIFGFEDLAGGGDKDHNDVIVRVNLSLA